MSDPLRSESPGGQAPAADTDRAARIEQLLLTGLDHYFIGEYDRAINVWTRVVFLDRANDRARAYIERARSAIAERQRESEELLHRGMVAFESGETSHARELLTRAVEQGGPQDVALVFLERLNRLEPGDAARVTLPVHGDRGVENAPEAERSRPRRSRGAWAAIAALLAIAVAGGALLVGLPLSTWMIELPAAEPVRRAPPVAPEPLPIARASDTVLSRARALYEAGRLKDAMRALDRIGTADPLRPQADELRGSIQRQLLDTAHRGAAPVAPPAVEERR